MLSGTDMGEAVGRLARWSPACRKTYLCQSLRETEYFDCELPRVRRMMDDPEGFLDNLRGKRIDRR